MSFYTLLPLIAFLVNGFLLFLVLKRDPRSFLHRIFSLFLLCMALWGFTIFGMRTSSSLETACVWDRAVMAVGVGISVFYFHFTVLFTSVRLRNWLLPTAYIVGSIFLVLTPTALMIPYMVVKGYGYAPVMGPLFFPYIAFTNVFIILGLLNLFKYQKITASSEEHDRAIYIIAGTLCYFLFGATDYLAGLGLFFYPLGIIGNMFFCILASVAILKYHLLDINIALRKGIAYLLMSALVAIPFVGIILGISHGLRARLPIWAYVLLLIALAFALQPGWRKIQDWVEQQFYRHRYEYIRELQEFSRGTAELREVRDLATPLLSTLASAMGTDKAYLFLPASDGLTLAASTKPSYHGVPPFVAKTSPWIRFLENRHSFLSRDDFDVLPQLQATTIRERNMLFGEMQGELLIPLRVRGDLVGVLVLGAKSNRQPYSADDLQILSATSPQLAISLDSARLYEMEKQRSRESALLLELGAIVTSELDMSKVYQTFIDKLRDILPLDYAHIALIEPHKGKLRFVAVSPETKQIGRAGESMPLPGTPTDWVSQLNALHYQPDLAKKADFPADEGLLESEIRSVVCLPLRTKQGVIGSFDVGSRMPNAYAENNLRLLQQVADQVAIATENSQLYKLEKEARAELERQDKERMELIDALAHELKTPLTPMMVSLELLPHVTPGSEQFKKMVSSLSHSAQSLNRRVSDLLEFARTQRAKVEIKAGCINIADAINKVATAILPVLQEKEQKLLIEVPSLPEVRADGDRVEQVLHNLLSNAVKFSQPGSLISVRARTTDAYVRVEIEDAASPLSPREQEEVFSPYHRGEKARGTPGLGIGLSICKHLVELQGGEMGVGSGESGNCFFFALPVAHFQRDER